MLCDWRGFCALEECRELLKNLDHQGILGSGKEDDLVGEDMDDDELLSALGVEPKEGSLQDLKYVRTSHERRSAEEVSRRKKCEDFEKYKVIFEKVKSELKEGFRQTVKITGKGDVEVGSMYILNGQMAYIAEKGQTFQNVYKRHGEREDDSRTDQKIRIIFDNETESNQLILSFKRAINNDDSARIVTTPAPLFTDTLDENDQESGLIYVLRSKCQHPEIVKNREIIHKIGSTNNLRKRLANASSQPTYLLADVEVVETFKLYNINALKFENMIQKIFSNANLDIELKDRFGKPFKPREWFLVPLPVIREAIEKIKDGTISNYLYNVKTGQLEADN